MPIIKDGNSNAITTANPLPSRVSGVARTANPTSAANGVISDIITTVVGAPVNKPYSIPELDWQYAVPAAIIDTTDKVLKAAGAAGVRNYVTGLQMINTNAVATEVVVKDGSTVIWRGFLQANMTSSDTIQFHTPLKGTAATAMNFAAITTAANVYVNAQGYQAP